LSLKKVEFEAKLEF